MTFDQQVALYKFQSTLPLRGATQALAPWGDACIFQSTLPLRGATQSYERVPIELLISIHTPLAGSDLVFSRRAFPIVFQSTLPLRGATRTRQ